MEEMEMIAPVAFVLALPTERERQSTGEGETQLVTKFKLPRNCFNTRVSHLTGHAAR